MVLADFEFVLTGTAVNDLGYEELEWHGAKSHDDMFRGWLPIRDKRKSSRREISTLNLAEVFLLWKPIGVVRGEELDTVITSPRTFASLITADGILLGQKFANRLEEIRFNQRSHDISSFGVARYSLPKRLVHPPEG
jgi:hypothetical protein